MTEAEQICVTLLEKVKQLEFENAYLKGVKERLAQEAIENIEKKPYASVEERQRYQDEIRAIEGNLKYSLRKAGAVQTFIKAEEYLNARIAAKECIAAIEDLELCRTGK